MRTIDTCLLETRARIENLIDVGARETAQKERTLEAILLCAKELARVNTTLDTLALVIMDKQSD